tara:strand:+ start:2736 stop:3626 length:891 start_codon:yes stop_codon:yes gene_type:complete
MAEKDETKIYFEVSGQKKKIYKKLLDSIKLMDDGNFVQSLFKFTFDRVIIHDHEKIYADTRYKEIIDIYDVYKLLCTNEHRPKRKNPKRLTCICSEELKYLYLWNHKNFKEKIIIGCTCFKNLCDYITKVYQHLPELMEHIKVLKKQFQIAHLRRQFVKCETCEKYNIPHDQDDGLGICNECKAEETRRRAEIEERLLRKQREEAEIARRRRENRKCYKCKDYNIPKDNRDICCDYCVTIIDNHKYIECLQCNGKVHVVPKQILHNGINITGCDLYCNKYGCRAGTRGNQYYENLF